MSQKISRSVSRLFLSILGILLGAGCGKVGQTEYGMPSARFRLDGTVRVRATQAPVESIRVSLFDNGTSDPQFSTLTGPDGKWAVDTGPLFGSGPNAVILAEDLDGPRNQGSFRSQRDTVRLVQTEGGSGFYFGTFELHGIQTGLDPLVTKSPSPARR